MSKEKQNENLIQMYRDLCEIFNEEYEKRRLITPQNTAEKMTAKGYRKQRVGEWIWDKEHSNYKCSLCGEYDTTTPNFCRGCGAKMKGGE